MIFKKLHIDIETYSSEDLQTAGVYRYAESIDFEIMLLAYAFDHQPVRVIDLAQGEKLPVELSAALVDPSVKKYAHNAAFERVCLRAHGIDVPISQWRCSAVKASYCGLPRSLGDISSALKMGADGKDTAGKALIRFFCTPVKSKTGKRRNMPSSAPEKWEAFKKYCGQDVEAEREIDSRLLAYEFPEWDVYGLDQEINDRGVGLDMDLVNAAIEMDKRNAEILLNEIRDITGAENPNSPTQLKKWLLDMIGYEGNLDKAAIESISKSTDDPVVKRVMELRTRTARSAIKKYTAMLDCIAADGRAHGLFLYYGAARTGRWSGRLIQLQNLYRNSLAELDMAREAVKRGMIGTVEMLFDDVSSVLAQLVRTALVPSPGKIFSVADFSAIEARVIAWLADEQWRLDVFRSGGDIYKKSYAQMTGIDIKEVTKAQRQKGKIAELGCSYGGSVGALKAMGGEKMGLSEAEMRVIVKDWRKASPNIVKLWADLESAAKKACKNKRTEYQTNGLTLVHDTYALRLRLPSGRELFYKGAEIGEGKFGQIIKYEGVDQDTKKWSVLDTYGPKLVENVVQGIARDLLSESMARLREHGFEIVVHVHDEVIAETNDDPRILEYMCEIMRQEVEWAPGLAVPAEGYQTIYYRKE